MHRGIYHQGKLRVNRYNPFEAYAGSESIGDEIIIYGPTNMNRAFDGDIVAVELLPQDCWQEEKSLAIANDEDDDFHLAPSSADDAPRVSNPWQISTGNKSAVPTRPSGRVTGTHAIVHRLLAASLGICRLPDIFQDRPRLTGIADNLNYRHRNAQMASRASVELHTLIYFRKRPTDTEARILKIRSNGFIVFVPKYGIEGPVYLISRGQKGGGEWIIDEQQQKIKKTNGEVSYGVLQPVRIHMEVVEPQPNRPKLELTLI